MAQDDANELFVVKGDNGDALDLLPNYSSDVIANEPSCVNYFHGKLKLTDELSRRLHKTVKLTERPFGEKFYPADSVGLGVTAIHDLEPVFPLVMDNNDLFSKDLDWNKMAGLQ